MCNQTKTCNWSLTICIHIGVVDNGVGIFSHICVSLCTGFYGVKATLFASSSIQKVDLSGGEVSFLIMWQPYK